MKKNPLMTTPICDFLRDYAASGISRFHMPGHKGLSPDPAGISYAHDITEISGADSLYEADGIILESERNAARLFGTAATYYSTEGSSQCIRAMLALVTEFGTAACRQNIDPSMAMAAGAEDAGRSRPVILAARNVHRAFITAAALLDLDVSWILPEKDSSLYSCPVTASQVEQAICSLPQKPAAVYLTSPDYLGKIQEIGAIADTVHRYQIPLLVDNAHGAYLHFLRSPLHPMDLGADLCCDSAHKTLPALTGCAYLHISRTFAGLHGDIPARTVRRALSAFGSTSPSYLLLESLDHTNMVLASGWKEQLAACIRKVEECKKQLALLGWKLPDSEPLKIILHASASGYTGTALAERLRQQHIECEYADPDFLVLMISPSNTGEDFERFLRIMQAIPCPAPGIQAGNTFPAFTVQPDRALSIREAFFAGSVPVPVEQAAGHICADPSVSCPPAIPLAVCGEIIPEEMIPVFRYYDITHVEVVKDASVPV